jgi:3-phosphoshikimate 1-carboxyvinyltransferase
VLSVTAAAKNGVTRIYHVKRLRFKESDRIESVANMLTALGCRVRASDDEIIIFGAGKIRGGTVDAVNDHRIAMSAAIASCFCQEAVTIKGAQAVNKSYPHFFDDFNMLGGRSFVI